MNEIQSNALKPDMEEALESLYLIEVEHKSIALSSDAETALPECISAGLIAKDTAGQRLTDRGRSAGRDVVRRHRLAECLLVDVLQDGRDQVHEDGCRMEHAIQHGLDERICVLLGHPRTCPHGHAIPEGECCRRAKADLIREVAPICDGKPGAEGTVAYLATRDNREVQKMMAMGILPGATLKLIQCFPSYVFQVGYSQFAVDRPLAEVIHVHWKTDPRTSP